jgi:hypothetical protein
LCRAGRVRAAGRGRPEAARWPALDQGMVEVTEIVTEVSGYLHFGPPKTRAGYRRVGLPRVVVEALAEQLARPGSADDLCSWVRRWHVAGGRIPPSYLAAGDQGGRAGWAAHP